MCGSTCDQRFAELREQLHAESQAVSLLSAADLLSESTAASTGEATLEKFLALLTSSTWLPAAAAAAVLGTKLDAHEIQTQHELVLSACVCLQELACVTLATPSSSELALVAGLTAIASPREEQHAGAAAVTPVDMALQCAACLALQNIIIRNGAAAVPAVHDARYPDVWMEIIRAAGSEKTGAGSMTDVHVLSAEDAVVMWAAGVMPWIMVERGCLSLCDSDVRSAWVAAYPMAKIVPLWQEFSPTRYVAMLPSAVALMDSKTGALSHGATHFNTIAYLDTEKKYPHTLAAGVVERAVRLLSSHGRPKLPSEEWLRRCSECEDGSVVGRVGVATAVVELEMIFNVLSCLLAPVSKSGVPPPTDEDAPGWAPAWVTLAEESIHLVTLHKSAAERAAPEPPSLLPFMLIYSAMSIVAKTAELLGA